MATESTALEGQIEKAATGVYLYLGNESFRCRKSSVSWHMMTFGAAQQRVARNKPIHKDNEDGTPHDCPSCKEAAQERSEAGMEMMAAMRQLILSIVVPSDRNRFLKFMDTAELDENELEKEVGKVIAELGKQDDSGPKAG